MSDNIWDQYSKPSRLEYDQIQKGLPDALCKCLTCERLIKDHEHVIYSKDFQFTMCVECYNAMKKGDLPDEIWYVLQTIFE